jgi:hypothetical protein
VRGLELGNVAFQSAWPNSLVFQNVAEYRHQLSRLYAIGAIHVNACAKVAYRTYEAYVGRRPKCPEPSTTLLKTY